ncbi:hypothetical protein O3P69_017970 [Scylla paramamosain]|uniref:F-actin-uncapping protein LRRC16A n=1 Tax=Scylla paramamosain TaxID=85552 RepID=A0AAW0THN0_SCYPA
MSGRNIITRELSDSIRQCLGRKVKLTLKVLVKVETRGDKTENRVLAFASCRLFVLTAKVPTRVDQHFHYLDIQGIESRKPNQLCLTVCDRVYTYYTTHEENSSHEVDTMVLSLCTALKNIFPSVPLTHIIRKVEIQPPKRMQQLEELERATLGGTRDMGPCGGFSTQYMCMCDYHALPYREEVAWDVDTIYLSHDTRELYLHDFDYLEQKDLIPIISALEYNTWFRKLRASHSKLSHEAIERILHVVSKSLSLEEIYLDNIGAKAEFANKLSLALLSNSNIPLQKLDLSHNPLEDKGAIHISNPIGRQAKGLSHLNLSHCGLTGKGVNMLAHSLSVNKYMCQTLTFLNLAGNSLRDDVNNLYNFLAQPNTLKTLDLSATECAIDALFGALLRGCTSSLAQLILSRNSFGSKKSREMLPSFKQYFTSTLALKTLTFSQCKLPSDALKNVLLGLACNENISEVDLDLSSNHLGATGAQILESCIHGVRCLAALDISDNGLETQLGPVVAAISKNKSIKKLNIGRNLNSIKSKHVYHVMEAVVQMIQEEDCVLESLFINDSRLKTDLHNLLNALGSNHCLQNLDISGNYMGDSGARLLAKALQINSKLQYISYDRNNVTLQGYSDIAYALQSNYSVKFLPFPVHDAMLCMKTAPERTENIMRRIQDILYRNVSPMKYSNGQAFRLQQGFLLSSTQQQVDRLVLQTGEVVRTLRRSGSDLGGSNSLQWVEGLIADADNSKQLISHLHDVVLRRDDAGNPIETKLHQLSSDLYNVISNNLQDTVESMVRSAQDKCPNVLSEEKVVNDIRTACLAKSQLSYQLVESAIVEQAGSVILNKVNEVNLAVASTVSDRVIDEVVESLSKTCKNLQSGEGPRKRASTGTEMGGRERGSSESSTRSERSDTVSQGDDTTSQKSDPSPLATPQLPKRKSLHGRKLRPQSVVDGFTDSSPEHPALLLHHSDSSVLTGSKHYSLFLEKKNPSEKNRLTLPAWPAALSQTDDSHSLHAESLDSVSELPSSCGQLQHLGKARPRRVKTRAPTRPMGRADLVEEDHDISEGVDTFFRPGSSTPTTPLISPDSENRTGSERGSIESLTRSDSLARSESDVTRDSPRPHTKSRDTEEEDEEEEEEVSLEEKSSHSVRSLIGRQANEGMAKRSPDMSARKASTSSSISYADDSLSSLDKSRSEEDGKEDSPPRKIAGLHKMGIGGNILAEMKKIQEKRTSFQPKDDEKDKEEKKESPSSNLLAGVRLRSTGLADSLMSPTNGFPRGSGGSKSPNCNRDSCIDTSGESGSGEAAEEDPADLPARSVKEMAASLAHAIVLERPGGTRKSSSLSHIPAAGTSSSSSSRSDKKSKGKIESQKTLSIISGIKKIEKKKREIQKKEELEETWVDGERGEESLCPPLHRQTSHKHVLATDLSLEDVVNV